MTDDELLTSLYGRRRPKTPAERAFVGAALTVYRERRAAGDAPEVAWTRCTDLLDDALVGPVMKAEARLAELPR